MSNSGVELLQEGIYLPRLFGSNEMTWKRNPFGGINLESQADSGA
jgi:hypothetical protein